MDTPSAPTSQALDQNALTEIQGMKPWLRFMSVLGFIGSAMCLLAALGMVAAGALIPAGQNADANPAASAFFMFGLAILYVLLAIPYLFLSLRLHRAANVAGDVLAQPTAENLAAFLTHHRKFWKLIGILSIAGIFLYIIAIVAAIAVPAISHISKK